MTIGIVLADDHKLFREGVRSLLEQKPDMKVLGEADDGRTAVNLVRELSPQVMIIDVTMPDLNGIDAARRIRAENPSVKVIALSMHAHRGLVREMLRAGAAGYLLKECAFGELVEAIHAVLEGRIFLSAEISQVVVNEYLKPSRGGEKSSVSLLTPREREILQLIAEGKTSEDVSRVLHMSRRTVEKHRARITTKLNIHSLAELTKYAIREGLTSL